MEDKEVIDFVEGEKVAAELDAALETKKEKLYYIPNRHDRRKAAKLAKKELKDAKATRK